ncbi:hypothetical protein SynBIOSE41_04014 [Synechococcus sp. BIOS-E4-1]|nr:hypothetical protein SynBIOSE41_04014 [Synechococcus sp. BIOS-E4-1]
MLSVNNLELNGCQCFGGWISLNNRINGNASPRDPCIH